MANNTWKQITQKAKDTWKAAYEKELQNFISGASGTAQKRYGSFEQNAKANPNAALQYLTSNQMMKPKTLADYHSDDVRLAGTDRAAYARQLREQGVFDTEDNAYGGYAHNVSTPYLQNLLDAAKAKLADSVQADKAYADNMAAWRGENEKAYRQRQMDETAFNNWVAMSKYEGKDFSDPDYDPTDEDMLRLSNLINGTDYKNIVDMQQRMGLDEDSYSDEWDKMVDLWYAQDWANPALPTYTGMTEPEAYESNTGYLSDRVNTLQSELDRRTTMEALEAEAAAMPNFAELSVYQEPEGLADGSALENLLGVPEEIRTSMYGDRDYFINNPLSPESKVGLGKYNKNLADYFDAGYHTLTDYEKKRYFAFVNANMQDKAEQYLEALSPMLLGRRADEDNVLWETLASDPATSGLVDFIGNIGQLGTGYLGYAQAINDFLGEGGGKNATVNDLNRRLDAIYQARDQYLAENDPLKNIKIFGMSPSQLMHKASWSIGGELGRNLLGGSVGSRLLAIGQSASGKSYENSDRPDMSNIARGLQTVLAGGLSGLTEAAGIDAFFDTGLPGAKEYIKKVLLSELGEEALELFGDEVIERGVSAVFGHKGEYRTAEEMALELAETMLMTTITVGGLSAPGAVQITQSNRAAGKGISSNDSIAQVLEIADSMDKSSASYAEAQNVKAAMEGGKKVSLNKLGRLANAMQKELGDEYGKVIGRVADDTIVDRMVELGDSKDVAQKNVQAVKKAAQGQNLTAQERADLTESSTAIQVVEELAGAAETSGEMAVKMQTRTMEAAAGIRSKQLGLQEAVRGKQAEKDVFAAEDDNASAKMVQAKPGTGAVTFLGEASSNQQVTGSGTEAALTNRMRSMTASQRNTVNGIKAIAKATGVNMVLFESTKEGRAAGVQNGSFVRGTNTIYLDINAGISTEAGMKGAKESGVLGYAMIRTLSHELTHFIEGNSKEGYAALMEQAKREFAAKGKDWDKLVVAKAKMSAAQGEKLTRTGAEAEVLADACEMMLQDTAAIERLARQNPSLKEKIAGFIKSFVQKIQKALRAIGAGSKEAKTLMEMRDGLMQYSEELTRLWGAGLEEAVGNAQGVEPTKRQGPDGEQMEADDVRRQFSSRDYAHPASKQFSIRQLAESLGYDLLMMPDSDVPYAIVDEEGNEITSFTADQVKNTPVGGLIDAAVAAGNIDDDTQQKQLKMIADLASLAAQYKDQAMVWEIAGSQLYSAIKNNSDKQYNKTVDFGTICSKTQAVVDVLSETMLKLDRGLTREEVITAYNKTAKNGLSVPCGPCYVFSRWMGVPGLLNSMANYQSRFGKMSAEEVTRYIDGVQDKYASDGERFSKVIGKQKTKLENRLESIASRMQRAMATGADMTDLFREADEAEKEYADVEAYNWVTQVLCQNKRVKGAVEVIRDSNGIVKLDPSYKPVPHSILFDMRRTGEFAKYPKSWKYRSTRGAGMGKSILPYSGASLGDTVYGDQKRRATSQNAFLNPNMTKAQRVRAIKNATKRMKSQNLIGGHRFQSTSDYRPEWGLDYVMTFLEMQAVSAKGQLYTKVIEAVDMFATAGIEVNLSIMANGDGWHRDNNGNPVLGVEDFSSVSGIDFTQALQKTKDYDNVQMILVGMNDQHIRLALADDRITFVIPWHSSGSSESILKQLFDAVGEELHTGSDYQEVQSDKPVAKPTAAQKLNADIRKKIITGKYAKAMPTAAEMEAINNNEFLDSLYTRFYLDPKATDTYGVKLSSEQASQVFPYEYWDTSLSYEEADENGRRFVRYCEDIGLVPRFEDFKDDHGYWKLLIDRRMYNRDGSYHTPRVIDVTNVKIGDIASSVSQAKYGDPVKTGNAVMETVEEIRTKIGSPAYPETSALESMEAYGDEVDVEPRVQMSQRLPDDISTREYLADADSSIAANAEQANALEIYKTRIAAYREATRAVDQAKAALAATTDRDESIKARNRLELLQKQQSRAYDQLIAAEDTKHIRELTGATTEFIQQQLAGKTEADIASMIADAESEIASLTEQLDGLKGASREQTDAVKEQIRMLKARVTRLRNSATRKLLETRQHYQEMFQRDRARREINAEAAKKANHIKAVVKRLDDRIRHETDYHNVKEGMKPAVRKLVETFLDGFGNLVFDQKKADRLLTVYRELDKLDSDEGSFYSDDVEAMLADLATLAGEDEARRAAGGSLMDNAETKLAIYSQVADIADNIWHMVQMADEVFVNGKTTKFSALGDSTGNAMLERTDYKQLYGWPGKVQRAIDDTIRRGNMIPTYFFESLDNEGLQSLFGSVMNGQAKYSQTILDGRMKMQEAKRKYNYAEWGNKKPVSFKTAQGHNITLTPEQMMWVYATAKRERSNELAATDHLGQGGFRYEGEVKGEKGLAVSDKPHKLGEGDVQRITDMLTADQKAYADELVEYLSNDMAEVGNAASMEMFGIRKYQEKYYFPFKTASEQRYQRSDAGSTSTTNDSRVKHSSFTHRLTRHANNTLVMGDFSSIIADHINQMATYASFMNPIESMNRVLNYKVEEDDGTLTTIRALLGRKYGDAALRYVQDFMKDINGGAVTDNRGMGMINSLVSAFKRGAVAASLSVAVQQPTAYVRAFAYMNPKYFAHLTGERTKDAWDEVMQYSGTAVIKDMGKFDVGLGQTANEWIAEEDNGEFSAWERVKKYWPWGEGASWSEAKKRWDNLLTALPGNMDKVTWTHIWKAVKAEQRDLHPNMDHQSEAFLRACGKRFDYIINHTQVYDSVLSKSNLMRSKNALNRMATSFMSEPTLTANVLYSAIKGKHSKAQRGKMIAATVASNILAAAAAAAVSAWNDDDDDRKAMEKYADKFTALAMDNLNPLGMLPYLSDVSSMLEGYSVERADASVVEDLIKHSQSFFGALQKGDGVTWKQVENFAGTLLNLVGVPAKNISRDVRRLKNAVNTDWSAASPSSVGFATLENIPYGMYADTKKAYYKRYVGSVIDGNRQKAFNIKDYMTSSKGTSESAWATGVRDVIKAMVASGSMTPEEATAFLREHAPYKNDKDNVSKPKEWAGKQ